MSLTSDIVKIQRWAGTVPDGNFGPVSAQAVVQKLGLEAQPDEEPEWHIGKASSFADPRDIAAFRRCKLQGKTDQQCFKVGDNGIGVWGQDTTTPEPACALPPDDMIEKFGTISGARNAKVIVRGNGKEVVCVVKDRMPWRKNIANGATIDLNPGAVQALGLHPPIMIPAEWKWV
jgi:hypothetical protein